MITKYEALRTYLIAVSPVVVSQDIIYSSSVSTEEKVLTVTLYAPTPIEFLSEVNGKPRTDFACYAKFDHLCDGQLVYGYDAAQALNLAANISAPLDRLEKKYSLTFLHPTEIAFYFNDNRYHMIFLNNKKQQKASNKVKRVADNS